ncbi:FAD dependent oxidoreductase, partial [Clavulina sp. PMI_390]
SSGKGGGFIAKDWYPVSTSSLGELSFQLHAELAEEHNGVERWGYRRLNTLSVDGDARAARSSKKLVDVPEAKWIAPVKGSIRSIGTVESTAQVHPFQLTNALVELSKEKGLNVIIGEASGVIFGDDGKPTGVKISSSDGEEMIEATDVVFTAGPWTGDLALKLLGEKAGRAAEIEPSTKSTSIVVTPDLGYEVTAHALFCTLVLADGSHVQPEIYARPDNTLYVCGAGMTDRTPLPTKAKDVEFSPEGVERLKTRVAATVQSDWVKKRMENDDFLKQACYRPDSSETGLPILGKINEGLWMASGHQVWGISLGPGTGKIMAQLLLDGEAISAEVDDLLV